ncbi:DUF4430 domain-containing protein [Bacillaceae bacterium S4-13-56]
MRTMNRNKILSVLSIFFLLVNSFVFVQPEVVDAATLERGVTISAIDGEGEEILPLTAVGFEEGDTAFDVLLDVVGEDQLEYSTSDMGVFLTGINGLVAEGDAYWSFVINGKEAGVGASSYEVKNAEDIMFKYISSWKEPPAPVKVSVEAKANNGDVLPKTEVEVMNGSNAYAALLQAAQENGVTVQASVDSEWLTFVNNIDNTELVEGDFWGTSLNGKAMEVGMVSYPVQEGDSITLTLDNYLTPTDGEDSPPTEGDSDESQQDDLSTINKEIIQNAINQISVYAKENNIAYVYGKETWIWALAKSGKEIPSSYVESASKQVKEVNGEFRNVFDLEKLIMGLTAAGVDATNFEGYDLVEALVNHKNLQEPSINMAIYALLAIDSGSYEVDQTTKDQLIEIILNAELEGGAWALTGTTASADITGMALSGLAPYLDQTEVRAAVNRAVSFLSQTQDDMGGFLSELNGGDSSESVSQVIAGLAAVGVDPTGAEFTKAGGNLVQHLLKFQQEDGGFSHLIDGTKSDSIATQQAFLALVSYQSFVADKGSVFQFEGALQEVEPTVDTGNRLPDTATDHMNFVLLGFILFMLGSTMIIVKKKQVQ